MDLLRLTNKLTENQYLNESNGLRKSMRQTPQLIRVLLKFLLRRKRYSFQLFKYFILFPGSSQLSEDISIDTYDRLIFGDDAIHSMIKIYQSKQIQNKIWGFINIKALKYLKTCKQFSKKVSKIYQQKFEIPVKIQAFTTIKQYDIFIQNQIKQGRIKMDLKPKYVDQQANTTHRQRLNSKSKQYDVKIQGKNYMNSRIIINSTLSNDDHTKSIESDVKQIQKSKMTESINFGQDLLNSQKQINESKISIKSKNSQKQKALSNTNVINQRSKSKTKIRFTYTSPSKQHIKSNYQKNSLNKLSEKKQKNKQEYDLQYKYSVPKQFNDKKICCENCCGSKCCAR